VLPLPLRRRKAVATIALRATTALPLPRRRRKASTAALLPLPHCRRRATAAALPQSCCHRRAEHRHHAAAATAPPPSFPPCCCRCRAAAIALRGKAPLFRGKRGSRKICNTKIYQPSFPLVSVGMIPTKYQPIPTKIPTLVCNSNYDAPPF
jgi:hypothetical protein